MKKEVDSWGGNFYFVYLPSHNSILSRNHSFRKDIVSLSNNLSINIIDIYPIFIDQDDPLSLFPFRTSGHYNHKGYELVAKSIIDSISK